ncbi:MAG TPA: preprotein translocase subunit SecA [Steroidobacteraceae bacterium]|nr:preprotein translocase subunit SecA [Steroidobacteraceae bacterium]
MLQFLTRVFGSRNDRLVRSYGRYVRAANELEPQIQALSDEALRAKTDEFRQRLKVGASVDALLPEAFAVVREAAQRTLRMRHFDVQLIGGIALHEGKISEMRTGEGKTLMATLPAYLNALPANGVHIVTVNEYLAQRDADWMGPIYRFLGLTVGVIKNAQNAQEKRAAYACDITYGTNNEFGFDYLRDNLAYRLEDRVQRGLAYAVVDEVDSILIDEARTPLIISGPAEESTELYLRINQLVPRLKRQMEENGPGDFSVEEKTKQVHITEEGHEHVEALMIELGLLRQGESLYDPANIRLMHHLNAALRAHALYKRDVEYIVRGGEVIIVDEFTGRTMQGRRWSDGLHQAVEAKEGVRVREENQTVASITFQNYFRLYRKLAGMTGTADTEAPEFLQIYGLEVVVIPTHRPMIRKDMPDFVYLTQKDKFEAIIEDIRDCVEREQPVLVGTTSIETSEFLAGLLQKEKIPHQVLNAKQHEREAHIVAQAGRPGAVTIATNMAGRGTDIVLGGNLEAELTSLGDVDDATRERVRGEWQIRHDKVVAAGGLHIVGTERHESRRIDNQLRGRSGRQGDPGSSRFYLSMEDNLMRIFGDPMRTKRLLQMAGMKEGEVIESGMLTRQIEKAQRKVESHNFDIRKQLLLFDDVANDQRKVVYQQRTEIMGTDDLSAAIRGIMEESVGTLLDQYMPKHAAPADWDMQGLADAVLKDFNARIEPKAWLDQEPELDEATLRARIAKAVIDTYDAKVVRVGNAEEGVPIMRHVEKDIMLNMLDQHWREHLAAMDYLRQGIHLRGYAQKDYRFEYKREAFELFAAMLDRVKFETVSMLTKIEVRTQAEIDQQEEERRQRLMRALQAQHAEAHSALAADDAGQAAAADPARLAGLPPGAPPGAPGSPQRGGVVPLPAAEEAQGTFVRSERKIGRNEPCPCGSGKKYKNCHGALSGIG